MIKIHGKYIRNIPEQVGKNKRDIFQLDSDLSALEVKVNEALAGVFHYKGSVATYGDLPASDNEVGDVYNVLDTGKNYAWDGSTWDDLGGLVDLSNYYTKAEADAEFVDLDSDQTITGAKTFTAVYLPNYRLTEDIGWFVVKSGANNVGLIGTGGAMFRTTMPTSNNAYDLGTSALKWKDIYLTGKVDFGTKITGRVFTSYITTDNYDGIGFFVNGIRSLVIYDNALYFTEPLLPNTTNTTDLGSSSNTWKNLFLSGNLSNGADSVTVSDLAALIAYAKSQGWIS